MSDDTQEIYERSGAKPFLRESLPEPGNVDPPTEDAAPKPPTAKKERKPATTTRTTSLEKRLTEMYVSIGTMVIVADPTCGLAVVQAAPEIGAALDNLAKENKSVRKALEKMLQGGAWGGVIMAHFPIITTVLAHHGLLPEQVASVIGVEPKNAKPTLSTVPTKDGDSVGDGRTA